MFCRLYRFLLRGCPAEVRAECGPEMEHIAHWLAANRGTHRFFGQSRALLDLVVFMVTARHDGRVRQQRNRRPRVWKLNQDIRTSFRQMRARPGFTTAIVGMLAL